MQPLAYSANDESYLFESMPLDATHTALEHLSGAALLQPSMSPSHSPLSGCSFDDSVGIDGDDNALFSAMDTEEEVKDGGGGGGGGGAAVVYAEPAPLKDRLLHFVQQSDAAAAQHGVSSAAAASMVVAPTRSLSLKSPFAGNFLNFFK